MYAADVEEGQRCDTNPCISAVETDSELVQRLVNVPNCDWSVCALDPVRPPTVPGSTAEELSNCACALASEDASNVSPELLVDTT